MKIFIALNLIFSLTFSLASKDQSSFIENLNLNFTLKNGQAFPDKFRVKFSEFDENFDFEFVKSTAHRGTDDVYVISNGQPTEYTFKSADLYEKYEQMSGDGWATLTRYKILNNQLRFIGTVYSAKSKNFAFDIYPVFTKGSTNYTSDSKKHQIKKRSVNFDYSSQNLDYLISPETFAKINNTISSRKKTGRFGLDGQPINLYVELLVVTDSSVYDYHRRFIGIDDQSLIFSQMRIYYAHLINGINQRYTNSLMNDPDLKIFIVLKNYLFLTNPADQTWLDVENVGDSNFKTYEGKEVVITDKTLTAFTNFINSKTFQFTFDHAVALFDKDLWSNDLTASPADRKGVAGFATIGQVCQTNKYSISEDSGGFANSIVIAHELGHNLGSLHDGQVGCDDSMNFIMTPVLNSNPPQTNFYLFSDCSINQFKSVLLNDQLNDVSSTASCLTNIPTSFPAELSLVSLTYPGLIWTANDQCKMQYGPQSSSCPLLINSGSCDLFCYPNTTSLSCLSVPGGAVDGTACDVGKICIKGECVINQKASNDTCLFGDTIMPTNVLVGYQLGLTVNQINCSELFRQGELANHGIDAYCSDPRISTSCCQSCRKYKTLTCKDNFFDCARYSTQCDSVLLNGAPIWQSCLRSCNRCPNINSVQRCNESNSLCQNGGTCRNITVSGAIGFECVCLLGYSGQFCETKNPCLPNPCLNGGTCNLLGSFGYTCSCLGICNSFNCEGCANPISITTTTATTTPAPFVNYCLSNPCFNGAICQNLVGGYVCTCLPGYTGQSCAIVINACSSNPCQNNGICTQSSSGSYVCLCSPGFTGINCQTLIDPIITTSTASTTTPATFVNYCLSNPCFNGAICQNLVGGYVCTCLPGYTGQSCEIVINACSSNPCQNNGICTQSSSGSYVCLCSPGFTGINCQTLIDPIITTSTASTTTPATFVNYCLSNPCFNGAICQNLVGGYVCTCLPGYTGQSCEIVINACSSNPCQNNGICTQSSSGSYVCLCSPGFTGINCQTLIDPIITTSTASTTTPATFVNYCLSNPCFNGAICQNLVGGYVCTCLPGYTGQSCEIVINACSSNPCQNNGICTQSSSGSYVCLCSPGFTGINCQTLIDPIITTSTASTTTPATFVNYCLSNPCFNGAICQNLVGGYVCTCLPGYTGQSCEIVINACSSNPCQNNGICTQSSSGSYVCLCSPGFTGINCQTLIDPIITTSTASTTNSACFSFPCQNGGSCQPITNGYNCICPAGYTGPNCNIIMDPCSSMPCLNNGICIVSGIAYTCVCLPGYSGFNCQNLINVCQPDPCNGRGICNQLGTSYQCTCNFGYTGTNCELAMNPCTQNPCVRGNCSSESPGTYECTCPCDFTGTNCQTQINFCSVNPCINGGACQNSACGLICICPNGFTGSRCETRVNFCDSFPCFGGATCVDQIFGYTCTCPAGFTGLNCNIQINNCDSAPCFNGGSCQQIVNGYNCICPNGFTGSRCEFRINNCISQPCQNNGTCNEITNGYACLCPAGYTGNNCQTFINYCSSSPCRNGGSCLSIVNGYRCICPQGFTGPNCDILIDPCSLNSCLNNGLCINSGLTYSCLCLPAYTGLNCQNLIDVSSDSTPITTLSTTTTTNAIAITTSTSTSTTISTSTTTSTFSISASTQKNCEDIDEFYCKSLNSFLATNCDNRNFFIKGFKVNDFCCKTCHQLEKNCFDSNIDCKFLGNFCNILDAYNPHPCRATCNRC